MLISRKAVLLETDLWYRYYFSFQMRSHSRVPPGIIYHLLWMAGWSSGCIRAGALAGELRMSMRYGADQATGRPQAISTIVH